MLQIAEKKQSYNQRAACASQFWPRKYAACSTPQNATGQFRVPASLYLSPAKISAALFLPSELCELKAISAAYSTGWSFLKWLQIPFVPPLF